MATIQLDCPSCGQTLELDSGFAGGVCRCSNCSAMMTVPGLDSREKPERVFRPDSPGRPDSPTTQAEREEASHKEEMADALARSDTRVMEAITEDDAGDAGDDAVLVTESGKEVNLKGKKKIPTAKKFKKRAVHVAVYGFIIALVVVLIAGGGVGVYLAINAYQNSRSPTAQTEPEYQGYDPAINPLTQAEPNFMQLPIGGGPTVVAIEAGQMDAKSLAFCHEMAVKLLENLQAKAGKASIQFVYWGRFGPNGYPQSEPDAAANLTIESLRRLQGRQTASGLGKFAPMANQLRVSKPVHLVLLTGGLLNESDLNLLRGNAQAAGIERIDIITLGDSDDAAKEMVKEFDGQYIGLPDEIWQKWTEQVEDSQ